MEVESVEGTESFALLQKLSIRVKELEEEYSRKEKDIQEIRRSFADTDSRLSRLEREEPGQNCGRSRAPHIQAGSYKESASEQLAPDEIPLLPRALKQNVGGIAFSTDSQPTVREGRKRPSMRDCVWSKERATPLPHDDAKVKKWRAIPGLIREEDKVSDAVKNLNASEESRDYYIVYSRKRSFYFLIFKRYCQAIAHRELGLELRWNQAYCVEICRKDEHEQILGKAILLDTNRFRTVKEAVEVLNFPFDYPGSEIYLHVGYRPYCLVLEEATSKFMLLYTATTKDEAFKRFRLNDASLSALGFFQRVRGWLRVSRWFPKDAEPDPSCRFDMGNLVHRHIGSLTDKYEIVKVLGAGIQGTTSLVRRRAVKRQISNEHQTDTDLFVAKESADSTDKGREEVKREFDILNKFRHPNCLKVLDLVEEKRLDGTRFVIVTEFAEGGDLYAYLHHVNEELGEFDEFFIANMFKQAMTGLAHLHAKDLVHNDLKPENLLVMKKYESKEQTKSEPRVVIGDFGCATFVKNDTKKFVFGDPRYLSPEAMEGMLAVLKKKEVPRIPSYPSDIWMMGVTIYGALSDDTLPFLYERCSLKDVRDVFSKFSQVIIDPNLALEFTSSWNCSEKSKKLLEAMLAKPIEDRPSAKQILRNEWFVKEDSSVKMTTNDLKHIRFASVSNHVRQIFRNAVAKKLQYETVKLCHEVFFKYDPDFSGQIDREEFQAAWSELGKPGADEIFDKADVDATGFLDFNEFAALCLDWANLDSDTLDDTLSLVVDDMGFFGSKGEMSKDEFRKVFEEQLGKDEDLDNAMTLMDTNKDGVISFEELKQFIQSDGKFQRPWKESMPSKDFSPLFSDDSGLSSWLTSTQGLATRTCGLESRSTGLGIHSVLSLTKPADRDRMRQMFGSMDSIMAP